MEVLRDRVGLDDWFALRATVRDSEKNVKMKRQEVLVRS
jgi:hypothetical protein